MEGDCAGIIDAVTFWYDRVPCELKDMHGAVIERLYTGNRRKTVRLWKKR